MDKSVTTSIAIQETLLNQAEALAQELNISQNELFQGALEDFIKNHQALASRGESTSVRQSGEGGRIIHQGDIYWVQLENPGELEAGIPHPYVVIQENLLNHSRIHTVVACALTSSIKRGGSTPGNVLLEVGEANLPKQSVVEVSKVTTIDKAQLGEYIGSLSEQRIHEILAGMRFLHLSFYAR